MSADEIDLRPTLRAGANLEEVKALLAKAIHHKPQSHRLAEDLSPQDRTMAQIGG
jgi:molybdenum cofactor biosynthesis enzyme MoaA